MSTATRNAVKGSLHSANGTAIAAEHPVQANASEDMANKSNASNGLKSIPAQKPKSNATHKPASVYHASPRPADWIVRFGQTLIVIAAGYLILIVLLVVFTDIGEYPLPVPLEERDREEMRDSWYLWILTASYLALQNMTTDQYLPNLGQMKADFHTTSEVMNLTLQINWLMKGLSVLLMVSMADWYGRKPMLLLCSTLTFVASLSCACVDTPSWFIAARVFQGISEGGEPIFLMIARDLIQDVEERMAYTSAYFSMLFLVPVIAPAFGGLVASCSSWRVPFVILSVGAAINTVCLIFFLGETRPVVRPPAPMKDLIAEVKRVFGDKNMVLVATVQAICAMIIMSVDTNYSLILADVFNQNQVACSVKLTLLAAVLVSGSILVEFLQRPFSSVQMLRVAMGITVIPIVGGMLAGWFVSNDWQPLFLSVAAFLVVSIICCLSAELVYFQPVKDVSGAAAGMNTCVNLLFSTIGSFTSGFIVNHANNQVRALTFWLGGSMIALFAIFWLTVALTSFKPSQPAPVEQKRPEMKLKLPDKKDGKKPPSGDDSCLSAQQCFGGVKAAASQSKPTPSKASGDRKSVV